MGGPKDFSKTYKVKDGRSLHINWNKGDDVDSVAVAFAQYYGKIKPDELDDIKQFIKDTQSAAEPPKPVPPAAPLAQAAPAPEKTKSDVDQLMSQMQNDLKALMEP